MRKSALLFEIPLSLVLSYGLWAVGILLPSVFVFTTYLAYLIIFFQILCSCFEVEFSAAARHYFLRYKTSGAQLSRMKMQSLYYCGIAVMVTHLSCIALLSKDIILMALLDLLCFGVVLLSLYCSSWLFQRCLKRQERLYPLAELALFIVSASVVFSIGLGLLAKRNNRTLKAR